MKRAQFASSFGVIAVTVGSAVGLGNIWRFPYEAGSNGGGAFLLLNVLFVFLIGVPVVAAEFVIGRYTGLSVRSAFKKLAPGEAWNLIGYTGLAGAILILGFYSVVAGWTMEYIFESLRGFGGVESVEGLHGRFDAFASDTWKPLLWTLLFLSANFIVLIRGVAGGIEKASNFLMPLLFLILLAFAINSFTLDKASEGLKFLFHPDLSKLTGTSVLDAMGQAFFSLSVGMGCLITYASYFKRDTPLVKTSVITASLDTFVAILSGIIIFPAVFTFGQEPAAGPKLVFEVLPSIFCHMTGGMIWSTLFFILLFVASLTSTLSICEVSIAYMVDELNMKRTKAVIITILIGIALASLCSLSFGPLSDIRIAGRNIFDMFDFAASNVLLPIGGMLVSIYVGFKMDRMIVKSELLKGEKSAAMRGFVRFIIFSLRWICPGAIGLVFLFGLGIF